MLTREELDALIDRTIAEMDRRDARIASFVAAHAGRSFCGAPRVTTGFTLIVVSPSCFYRGAWRVTRFDRRDPSGHTECATYAEAVRLACEDWGVDLDAVEFSNVARVA